MADETRVTVCGGGRGATTLAGDLVLMGCKVTLFQLPSSSRH
jgi:hypothetical protein